MNVNSYFASVYSLLRFAQLTLPCIFNLLHYYISLIDNIAIAMKIIRNLVQRATFIGSAGHSLFPMDSYWLICYFSCYDSCFYSSANWRLINYIKLNDLVCWLKIRFIKSMTVIHSFKSIFHGNVDGDIIIFDVNCIYLMRYNGINGSWVYCIKGQWRCEFGITQLTHSVLHSTNSSSINQRWFSSFWNYSLI